MNIGCGKVPTDLRTLYVTHGQGHVFEYVDKGVVDEKGINRLVEQLQNIDVKSINELYKSTFATPKVEDNQGHDVVEPIKSFGSLACANEEMKAEWYAAGLGAVSEGKVGMVTLSGGQGTRLGFSGPKGMYNIGLPSAKSLFQLQAERLRRLCALANEVNGTNEEGAGPRIPWYIMTSPLNDEITRKFFADSKFFGMSEGDIFFFPQGTLPCMTTDGKLILESASKVAIAPDGNGGIYPALERTGALADMRRRGVQHLHVSSIDNALLRVADPHFFGYCILNGADCGNKSVWKSEAEEKVGVVVLKGGKPCVLEYSEMNPAMCKEVDEKGKLVFGAGNICNHYFSRIFLEDIVLPKMGSMFHVAHKKIPAADGEKGETVKPTFNNGIKLESFIFDVFPLSEKMVLFEAPREDEFAPVKNAPGDTKDSPDTARGMISAQALRWVEAAGGKTSIGSKIVNGGEGFCEVSPLVSYGGEGLKEKVNGKALEVPFHIED
ncbi:unnamed protein product [Choristocarpus tenellus]